MSDPVWQKRLEEILGPQGVSSEGSGLPASSWEGPRPAAVAYPVNREQVCELLRMAAAERLKVSPFGSGTKLRLGGIPQPVDLAISLERMNRVCDYPASDLTLSVEAGLPVRELERTLRPQRQMLPLDVPFADRATVGGMIASGSTGPRRLAYGSWRDIVLGVQFVTAEGKLVKGGGKVVKNVAGYDTPKLLIGSLGTLGILVEVTFKVFPIPPASAAVAMRFASVEDASQAARHILNSPLIPQSLELVDAAAGAIADDAHLRASSFTLLAGIAGPAEALARFEHELPALVRAEGMESYETIAGEREVLLWKNVQELIPAFLSHHSQGLVVKASLPLTRMGDFIAGAGRIGEQHSLTLATLARAGSGIVYACLRPESGEPDEAAGTRAAQAAELLIREAEQHGGRAFVKWCPAEWKSKINLWGTPGDDLPWMRKLKAALDPQGILNPGRFYGGI